MKIRANELKQLIREQMNIQALQDDGIIYGNSPLEFQDLADAEDDPIKNWFIDSGLAEKICREAPANSSRTTQRDLTMLVEMSKNASGEDITFARYVDDLSNLAQSFIDLLAEKGHEEDMMGFFRIDGQTESILYYLKDVINRPRPYQLARHYGYPLYPLMRTDAMTASYPSGHALAGYLMSEYYAGKYPDVSVELRALGHRIAKSREITGIHYPSDTQISKKICRIIIENGLLQE